MFRTKSDDVFHLEIAARSTVDIDVRHNRLEWHGRKVSKVVGAEQTHLFAGHKHKRNGAAWRLRKTRVSPGDFEQSRCARRIVEGAVTHRVTIHCRADSEMIHVSGIHNVLIPQ